MINPAPLIIITLSLLLAAWLAVKGQAAPMFISPVMPTPTPAPVWHIYMPVIIMED